MKVAVGTQNLKKVNAVMTALELYDIEYSIEQLNVKSGVPKQPFEEEIYQGAVNRVFNMKKLRINSDIYIGIEGGIMCKFGHYFNVQVAYILTKNDEHGVGISSALPIPEQYIQGMRGTSFSRIIDQKIMGGTGVLTNFYTNRQKLIEESVVMALTSIINPNWNLDAKL